jgi:predicted heme/steroid binding protein
MAPAERKVTLAELRRNTGERGTHKWIAYGGRVYDVTDCPRWKPDLHEHLHFPGQDLTIEFSDAPHKEEVLTHPCIRVVGVLIP